MKTAKIKSITPITANGLVAILIGSSDIRTSTAGSIPPAELKTNMTTIAHIPMAAALLAAISPLLLCLVSSLRPSAAASISSTVIGARLSAFGLLIEPRVSLALIVSFFFSGKIPALTAGLSPMTAQLSVVAS